jgi:hypothetical protein
MKTLPPVWWMDADTYAALSKSDKKKVSKAIADYETDVAVAKNKATDAITDIVPDPPPPPPSTD